MLEKFWGKRDQLGWNIWERAHHGGATCSGFENYSDFTSLNRGTATKQLPLGHYWKELIAMKSNQLAKLGIKHISENRKIEKYEVSCFFFPPSVWLHISLCLLGTSIGLL